MPLRKHVKQLKYIHSEQQIKQFSSWYYKLKKHWAFLFLKWAVKRTQKTIAINYTQQTV